MPRKTRPGSEAVQAEEEVDDELRSSDSMPDDSIDAGYLDTDSFA